MEKNVLQKYPKLKKKKKKSPKSEKFDVNHKNIPLNMEKNEIIKNNKKKKKMKKIQYIQNF